jgi:phage shock protein A
MANESLKQAAKKAAESAMQSLMPELIKTVKSIEAKVDKLDTKIDRVDRSVDTLRLELKEEIHDQWDRVVSRMSELGERLAQIEGQFKELTRGLDRQTDKMDQWIERLVRIEMTQTTRKKKAG